MTLSAGDVQAVYALLSKALSLDDSDRKSAESALAQCENRPGFCSCLLELIVSRDSGCLDDVRLLASVYLKNNIICYWRNHQDAPGIGNDEKIHIRNKLLSTLREENVQIALLLAVLVAQIGRIDYPKEWPELFSSLGQQLQTADTLASHRLFMVLFQALKELSTKRLSADKIAYQEIASQLFHYTWTLWKTDVDSILKRFFIISSCSTMNLVEQGQDLLLVCERWFLCLKIIRQLTISGYPSDTTSAQGIPLVKEVCSVLLNAVQSFLPYYSSLAERQVKFWDFTGRTCIKLMKVLVALQSKYPYSFVHESVLPPIADFSLNKIMNPEGMTASLEQFLVQCMVLVKSILECKEYKPSVTGHVINEFGDSLSLEQRKQNLSVTAADMLKVLFPSDRVTLLCNVLIRRYFIFTAKDIDEWYQNPEYFHHDQDMVQWTESLRPCAEALYIVLFENYSNLLGPVVVSILHEATSGSPPVETEISSYMLLKDAAYTAAGHVYYELSRYLNFSDWFHVSLASELSNDHPNVCIIHRRIALLLGQWVPEIEGVTRKQVYHALVRLFQGNDIAVRLAACRSLCHLVQNTNFFEKNFLELLPPCWSLCFRLMEEAQEFDSKVQVLNLISVLIEHVGERIMPYAIQLSSFFSKIWEESSDESLLQIQLLAALRNFIFSLGYQSTNYYNMILPILKSGLDVDNPDSLNLLEDSVLLWEATLCNATSIVPQLLDFFPCLVTILDRSFDHLQVAISIIEDYIIFGGSKFLSTHASSVAKVFDAVIRNGNDKGLLSTFPTIDLFIQCFPLEAPPMINGILQKLILIFLTGEEDRDPLRTAVRASSGAILARVLVMNTNYFAQLTSEQPFVLALHQARISPKQNVLLSLADMWARKIDNAIFAQRKMYALALSVILTLRMPQVIDRLGKILSVCASVILGRSEEVSEDDSSVVNISSVPNNDEIRLAGLSSKDIRIRQIKDSDPLKQFSLENSVKENLKTCATIHGDASINAAISKIHPSAFAQIQHALKMSK